MGLKTLRVWSPPINIFLQNKTHWLTTIHTSVLVREAGLPRKCPLPYIHCLPSKWNSIATEEKCLCITQGRKHGTHNTQTVVRCIKTKTVALSLCLPSMWNDGKHAKEDGQRLLRAREVAVVKGAWSSAKTRVPIPAPPPNPHKPGLVTHVPFTTVW